MKNKKKIRIGVLGLVHDHVWENIQDLKKLDDGELIAAADPNQPLLDQVREKFGCAVYGDYQEMLDKEQLDAVYIFSDNASGADLAEMAAGRKLHILIEKPMAASLEGADRMLAAARNNGVRMMVNWPTAWWGQLQHAFHMAAKGEIGQVWQVKYRAAHAGPREMGCSKYFYEWLYDADLNGGGAFIDYCCYGAALCRLLLGMPSRVTGVSGRFCKEDILVEDNGILVMTTAHGMAVAEASWSQIGYLSSYVTMIYGTKGTLMVEPMGDGKLILATAENPKGAEISVPKAQAHMANASAHFLHCLQTGEEFTRLCNDRLCRDVQEILEAGLISATQGMEVSLPLKV